MRNKPMPCPCGSNKTSYWQFDARAIPLCRTCEKCHAGKMAQYRPEVLSNADYETTEQIEED
jgi:hypothetical protein